MDEDVEIMSEDEEKGAAASEDSLHLKPKTKDKKQVIYIILSCKSTSVEVLFTKSDKDIATVGY
jgi:ribosome maturation protein Sdo1